MFRRLHLAAWITVLTGSAALAQDATVAGFVLRVDGADTVPASDVWAVLHRVTAVTGAAVDSTQSDGQGRYRLRAGPTDSAATYIVSVRYAGIAYFSEPRLGVDGAATLPPVLVFDTSSVAPPITVAERHIVVEAQDAAGGTRILELVVLANDGTLTRYPPDSAAAVWSGDLPAGVEQFEVGAADLAEPAVSRRGDRVVVSTPMPPGRRQMLISYVVPNTVPDVVFVLDQEVGVLNLLIGDSTVSVVAPGLTDGGVELLEGRPYRRFAAFDAPAGAVMQLTFRRDGPPTSLLIGVLVPLVMLAMIVVWWRWRARAPVPPARAPSADELARQIAGLDRTFAGRENEAYRRQREELKAQLAAALAQSGRPT